MNGTAHDVVLACTYSVPTPRGEVDLVVNLTLSGCGSETRCSMDDAIASASAKAREQVCRLASHAGERFVYTYTGSKSDGLVRA